MIRNLGKAAVFLSIPLGLLLPGAMSLAAPPEPGMMIAQENGSSVWTEKRAQHEEMMAQRLGLTAEQREKMKSLREQGKGQTHALYQQLRAKKRGLMEYIQSPNASEAKALELQAEISQLQSQLGAQRIKTWFQMRQILTPEQLQRMQQLKPPHPGGPRPSMKKGPVGPPVR